MKNSVGTSMYKEENNIHAVSYSLEIDTLTYWCVSAQLFSMCIYLMFRLYCLYNFGFCWLFTKYCIINIFPHNIYFRKQF